MDWLSLKRRFWSSLVLSFFSLILTSRLPAMTLQDRYYAHETVTDRYGVIAPWYEGQNGQCDFRVRVAAETLKRYPWTDTVKAVAAVPEYVFNGHWSITPDGTITVPPICDWNNGDLGQRIAFTLAGLIDYYRYSGDPAAIAHVTLIVETLLDQCLTGRDHPWPQFPVSVPIRGKVYGRCDPHGMIQLDIAAHIGQQVVRAYQLTGTQRWFEAARHWADLFAENSSEAPGLSPWNRYANPEDVAWNDRMTGGVAFVLAFLDEILRTGHTGKDNSVVEARDAGSAYLRDVLLPRWTGKDTWGRHYWDVENHWESECVVDYVARYLMSHPEEFPNWQNDVRNILTLFITQTCVNPASGGDVFHGAWAYPESSGCCGRSLWYAPLELAPLFAQYAGRTGSEWARELARRQMILATYDCDESGVVEDNIDGGSIVAGAWFKIAHPMALANVLDVMAWMPDVFGSDRENHILRTSSVVTQVAYGPGQISYSTFDAPPNTIDVLRLAFEPESVAGESRWLPRRHNLEDVGYHATPLGNGDWLVHVRHDGERTLTVRGPDPQQMTDDEEFAYQGTWEKMPDSAESGGSCHVASASGSTVRFSFSGNQVRLIGRVDPTGGLADVCLDGRKQWVGIDCWNPAPRYHQILYYRNGLTDGTHELMIVARGEGNPASKGTRVYVDAVQWSGATGHSGFGEGGGPVGPQRVVFGYPGRQDVIDAEGNQWRPATEFVLRSGALTDVVEASWWTEPRRVAVEGTVDTALYRHGVHGKDFTHYFTVGPGKYSLRLLFAETRRVAPAQRAVTVHINGREVARRMDIAATAARVAGATSAPRAGDPYRVWAGLNRALDLTFPGIEPEHGLIAVRFSNDLGGEAMVQSIELLPDSGQVEAKHIEIVQVGGPIAGSGTENLLVNAGFEEGVVGALGSLGSIAGGKGWSYVFASSRQSYVWGESGFDIHPDWGLPVIRNGKEALRTHTDRDGHTIVYQEVPASPETDYIAGVWVRTDDLSGKGFGTHPCDLAGLVVQELSELGTVVAEHPRAEVTDAGDWRELSLPFTTGKQTTKVRFVLETVLMCPYDQGHVTYDDCSLMHAEE